MDKHFEPSSYEQKWQRSWAARELYRVDAEAPGESYCIMIPPPNVTGKLHMGHALQSTVQDLLTRWRRMQGRNALWLPGTDHAGIATQLMVEKQLTEEGLDRRELGREKFLERAWEWTREYKGNIRTQMDKLGTSCDWSRERFTFDEGLSEAVGEAFVRLYEEGLIYRAEYMVNWSPGLDTAISDLEVESKAVDGKLYHIRYPIADSDESIVVATTRPETLLGDTAIAYHPDDPRAAQYTNWFAVVPLVDREVPFVPDAVVDPEFGTGLVKVTPQHDPNDFEIGRRHDLPGIQVIDRLGRMTEAAGAEFAGLDRYEARKKVVVELERLELLEKVEPHQHNVGHCQRSGVPVEPLVSTQWFCNVETMAARALSAVHDGDLELIPSSWDKTWEHWLANIRPWCISRQLWWGHQVPAWYTADGECVVARTEAEAVEKAGTSDLTRDEDVLDTWFSSALWPFSTLGWPEPTADLKTFYPTQVMVTGFDILFFWVARMVMTGLHFTDELPFRKVHLTGLVRDAKGLKMSKTRGNTVDPLDLVERYGADAVRFTLAALDSPGSDIPLDEDRIAGYRGFGNKIWNATRYVLSAIDPKAVIPLEMDASKLDAPERWILSRLSSVAGEIDEKLETFRFDEACHLLYHFFWGDLCDRYIELSKPSLTGVEPRSSVSEVLLYVLDRSLRLLHPVMPYLTEELWQRLPGQEAVQAESIALASYPRALDEHVDREVEERTEAFFELVGRTRSMMKELQLGAKSGATLHLASRDKALFEFLEQQQTLLRALTRVERVSIGSTDATGTADRVAGVELILEAPERSISEAELGRLGKEADKLRNAIRQAEERLSNETFLSKAPEQVVAQSRASLDEMRERLVVLEATITTA